MSEEQIIQQYKLTGDQQHLSQLYKPYMTLIYGTCLKYLKNPSKAEDAVMDIYLSLVDKVIKHDIKKFSSWIYRLSVNHCLEQLRSSQRIRDRKNEAEHMYSEQIFHPDDVTIESKIKIMAGCIDNLNDSQKRCINLFYYEKMSYKDIADQLSMSYTNVRSAIQNGRRNISKCMALKTIAHHEG